MKTTSIEIEKGELIALEIYHRDKKRECAQNEDYLKAEFHKCRAIQLGAAADILLKEEQNNHEHH